MSCSHKKRLLLVGAGQEQIAAIQAAHALDLFVIAADANPLAPGLAVADQGVCADIQNIEILVQLGRTEQVHGVFSHAVDLPHVVAAVAQELSLPGLSPDVAIRATNKWHRYQCLESQGVPCPKFRLVQSVEEAHRFAQEISYPVVIKPLDSAGARGVCKVNDYAELESALECALQYSHGLSVLVEEFLQGYEISTESIIANGKIFTTGFADRNYCYKERFAPFFIEDGHTIPSELSHDLHSRVIEVVEQAIRSLNIDWGVAKGDVIIQDSKPYVFEMAPRTSGGRFCADMVPLATGVQILPFLISMAVGDHPSIEDLHPKFQRGAAQRFLFPYPGEIVGLYDVERVRNLPGIYDVVLREDMTVGGLVPQMTNHSDRIGHVIASGDTRDEAVQRVEHAVGSIHIETRFLAGIEA
jgi:biotin carboxylase